MAEDEDEMVDETRPILGEWPKKKGVPVESPKKTSGKALVEVAEKAMEKLAHDLEDSKMGFYCRGANHKAIQHIIDSGMASNKTEAKSCIAAIKEEQRRQLDRRHGRERNKPGEVEHDPDKYKKLLSNLKSHIRHWSQMTQAASGDLTKLSIAQTVKLGGVIYKVTVQEATDYQKYSKAWHRRYGPARTVIGRQVRAIVFDWLRGTRETGVVEIDSFRGKKWIDKAIKELHPRAAEEAAKAKEKVPLTVRMEMWMSEGLRLN